MVFHGNESALNYGFPHNGTRESPHAHTYDFWPADMYKDPFDPLEELERITLHPNAMPHVFFIAVWIIWYATGVLNFNEIGTFILTWFSVNEKDFAEANDEM